MTLPTSLNSPKSGGFAGASVRCHGDPLPPYLGRGVGAKSGASNTYSTPSLSRLRPKISNFARGFLWFWGLWCKVFAEVSGYAGLVFLWWGSRFGRFGLICGG